MNGSTVLRILGTLVVLIVLGIGGFFAFAWQSEISPIDPPVAASFEPAQVQ